MTRGRLVAVLLAVAITAATLALVARDGSLPRLVATLGAADPLLMGLAVLLAASAQILRAARFHLFLAGQPPIRPMLAIAFQLNLLNFAIPFRLGELGYPVLVRRAYGEPLLRSLGTLATVRLLDLMAVTAILLVLLPLAGIAEGPFTTVLALASAGGVLLGPLYLLQGARRLVARRADRLEPGLLSRLADGALAVTRPAAQARLLLLTLAIWIALGLAGVAAAAAVASSLAPTVVLFGTAAGNIAFALPVTGVAGIGTPQVAYAAAAGLAGVPWSEAIIAAFALHAAVLASATLFGGAAMLGGLTRRNERADARVGERSDAIEDRRRGG